MVFQRTNTPQRLTLHKRTQDTFKNSLSLTAMKDLHCPSPMFSTVRKKKKKNPGKIVKPGVFFQVRKLTWLTMQSDDFKTIPKEDSLISSVAA